MRYKVNTNCPYCGRRFSYWNDDEAPARQCPFATEHEAEIRDELERIRRGG